MHCYKNLLLGCLLTLNSLSVLSETVLIDYLYSILQFLAFDEGRFLWTAEPVYYCDSCAKPSEVQSTSQQQAG
ncbi:MAG: hypothetical protein ACR2PX_14690, partial [Endozoicomonas sp.]|uniref:hypothetical protein n=1 Tax=Endozoicomonas sp. TaxID=1892382 RepID=UPI003D9BE697